MPRSLTGISAQAILKATVIATSDGGVITGSAANGASKSITFTSGTSTNQADRFFQSTSRTLSSGGSEDIDMYDLASLDISGAGAGRDSMGQLQTLAEVAAILVYNSSSSAGTLLVGGKAATTAWNSLFNSDDNAKLSLPPNSFVQFVSGNDPAWAVTDVSNHLLTIAASGGACTYDIYFLGRSA